MGGELWMSSGKQKRQVVQVLVDIGVLSCKRRKGGEGNGGGGGRKIGRRERRRYNKAENWKKFWW